MFAGRSELGSSEVNVYRRLRENPFATPHLLDFHRLGGGLNDGLSNDLDLFHCRNAAIDAAFRKTCVGNCTKSGQRPVDGLHSPENTTSYKHGFFIDWKNGKSKTGSFFDSF
jgi:hypothetical protein